MFKRPPKFRLRMVWMILGIILMGAALSVLIKLELGTDPYSCFVLGLSRQLHISYGNCQLMVQLVMFSAVICLGRDMIGFGTIGNMVFVGYITDFGTYLLDGAIPSEVWSQTAVRYGALLPAMIVFVTGAALYMAVELGVSPYDGMPFVLQGLIKKVSFRTVRIVWDFLFLSAGFLLGGRPGVVTLLCVCFLGPVISWLRDKMVPYLEEEIPAKSPALKKAV